jgi:hypothetical protein
MRSGSGSLKNVFEIIYAPRAPGPGYPARD